MSTVHIAIRRRAFPGGLLLGDLERAGPVSAPTLPGAQRQHADEEGKTSRSHAGCKRMGGWSSLGKSIPVCANVRSGVQGKFNCISSCPSLGASIFTRTFIFHLKGSITQKLRAFMTSKPSCAFRCVCTHQRGHAQGPLLE